MLFVNDIGGEMLSVVVYFTIYLLLSPFSHLGIVPSRYQIQITNFRPLFTVGQHSTNQGGILIWCPSKRNTSSDDQNAIKILFALNVYMCGGEGGGAW